MENKIIEVCTDMMETPKVGGSLSQNRASVAEMQQAVVHAEVSIVIQAYNRLEKTRNCVESVLQYTTDVNYELILIDNGSQDTTMEYFLSVPCEKKKIVHITKNVGASFPNSVLNLNQLGRFVCFLASDLILTPRWLENLLVCIKSDDKIGMVNPVSSNTSNLQEVDLAYQTIAEMQEKARVFNCSTPQKWEERLRLITLGALYRKEALYAIGWPLGDVGFFHDFGDDDVTFRIRRAGYRTVLAGDTWICHDHDFRRGEGKDPTEFQESLNIGRTNFKEKYFGVDAWEDVNNYYCPYTSRFPPSHASGRPQILGVDVRCGTPILDIKNWLRGFNLFDVELSAFTQDPKYWVDLKTICAGPVICDREEFLVESFPKSFFDYVVVDRPLNRYHEPQKMLNDLFTLCKEGGIVICKLSNTFSFRGYLYQLGQRDVYEPEFSYDIPLEVFQVALEKVGTVQKIIALPFCLDADQRKALDALVPAELQGNQRTEVLNRMTAQEFLLIVEKKV